MCQGRLHQKFKYRTFNSLSKTLPIHRSGVFPFHSRNELRLVFSSASPRYSRQPATSHQPIRLITQYMLVKMSRDIPDRQKKRQDLDWQGLALRFRSERQRRSVFAGNPGGGLEASKLSAQINGVLFLFVGYWLSRFCADSSKRQYFKCKQHFRNFEFKGGCSRVPF